jgi:acetyl-CoA carboxylase carboxyl transferase subunit beta
VFDDGEYLVINDDVVTGNPINFPGYESKLKETRRKTGLEEACVCATGNVGETPCVVTVLDNRFLMGSMGASVGEMITRSIEFAKEQSLSLIIFSTSGGARMQEGLVSLMQMAKTSAAIKTFSDAGGLYISCLTDPTMGGVSASFAFLGDVIIAEPGALIGFAGPRVIEQTIGEKLPDGFQRAEFLLEHGFIDAIVSRAELRNVLIRLLRLHGRDRWRN